jgi:hypothetical protein
MRALMFLPLALLGACLSSGGSYALGPGVATYDALAAGTQKCRADGGVVALRSGYDKRDLASYECNLGGGK